MMLAVEDRAGVAVLTNLDDSDLAPLAAEHLLDRLVRLPPRVDLAAAVSATGVQVPEARIPARVPRTQPAHALADYAGRYVNAGYGPLVIDRDANALRAQLAQMQTRLEHWHYETFVPVRGVAIALPRVPFTFVTDAAGAVVAVDVPFEPSVTPIRFDRAAR